MQLCIQDPSYAHSMYLHESLLMACKNGINGGGAYAFASKGGVELLFADEIFNDFMKNGKYYLVVGMDDITNTQALKTLKQFENKYNGHLIIKAYIHNSRKSTFHPKCSWFQNDKGGYLVIGSGNLTERGLRHNREAYSVINCEEQVLREIIDEWNSWIQHSQPFLFNLDDPLVLGIAVKNETKAFAISKIKHETERKKTLDDASLTDIFKNQPQDVSSQNSSNVSKGDEESKQVTSRPIVSLSGSTIIDEDDAYWEIGYDSPILVAEIPKSGDRWKQVNFSKEIFENYFGATCGENGTYRILLRNVENDGTLGDIEVRPSVSVSSHNYRFELNAATGKDYPTNGNRPIGVFAKVAERDFLYELVMPENKGYTQLETVLKSTSKSESNKMIRLSFSCKQISSITPDLAIWQRIGKESNDN